MSTSTHTSGEQGPIYCNGCEERIEGHYHYGCPYCGFAYCYECFKKILIAETGCPSCLGTLWL